MPDAPDVSVVRSLDIPTLRDEWDVLVASAQEPSVFLTWDWMDVWYQVQHRKPSPYLITAREDGRLAALAPLVSVARRLGPWELRVLEFMGVGVGADHLTFLAVRDKEDVLHTMVRWLAGRRQDWDIVDLARADEALAQLFLDEFSHDRQFRVLVAASDKSPLLPLPGSWHALAASLNSNLPAEVEYKRRRLAREVGNVLFYTVRDDASFDVAWSDLVRLHTRRWKERGLPGAFADGDFERFHKQFARRGLQRGWLRLYRLEVGGHGVAVLYCLQIQKRVSYMQGGFDPAMRRYSVGTLLMAHAIRAAIEEGATEFDFLRGAELFKMRWASSARQDYRLLLVGRRPRNLMALAWRQQMERLRSRLKTLTRTCGTRFRPTRRI